uniref:WAP domain-containing protein n=1 Tax=Panagrolaimus sp. ES5 TaxID=591445 RepID=A0AC34GDG8_9BILA
MDLVELDLEERAEAPKFVVRCINGGAHIGQCRLDEDAICIALGGTCINSQCCTTPFYGLMTTSTTTNQPLIIDGDAFRPKMQHSSEEDEEQKRRNKSSSEEEAEVVEEATEPAPPIEEEEKIKEIDELSRLLEFGKRNGLSTDSPIYAIFAGLFGVTTSATTPPTSEWIRKETLPEEVIEATEKPLILTPTTSTYHKFQTTTTTFPNRITVTYKPPANSVETSSSEEAGVEGTEEGEDYTKRLCDDGSHAIGPCNDDGSCPLDHTCQKGTICCFNFATVAKYLRQHD